MGYPADDRDNVPDQPHKMTFRRALPQILATNAKNILLLGYGMTLGFPTIVIPSVSPQSDFNATTNGSITGRERDILTLTWDQISWFSSINLLCVPIGCFMSGIVTQPFGRKPSMMALNVPFIVSWLLYRYCNSVATLYAALALTGLTGGLLEAPVLTYVAEITEPEVRGVLAAMSSMCVILGVFVQFLLGTLLHWRSIALVNIAVPVFALLAISFVPESPHWLVGRGRLEDAEKSLMWLRGWVESSQVKVELDQLQRTIHQKTKHQTCSTVDSPAPETETVHSSKEPFWRPYFRKTFLHPYGVVCLAFFVGHFGGMTTLQTFAVSIFTAVGSPLDKYVSTLAIGLVQLLGSLCCMGLVRYTGKRPLAVATTALAGICFLTAGLYASKQNGETDSSSGGMRWVPLAGLVGAAFFTHVCIRLLPWMLIGEVYTPRTRSTASGMSGGAGYILGFAANKSYLYLVGLLSVWGVLVLDAAFSLAGALALYYFLPETEGKPLHEVQEYFKPGKGARVSSSSKEKWAATNPALDTSESRL